MGTRIGAPAWRALAALALGGTGELLTRRAGAPGWGALLLAAGGGLLALDAFRRPVERDVEKADAGAPGGRRGAALLSLAAALACAFEIVRLLRADFDSRGAVRLWFLALALVLGGGARRRGLAGPSGPLEAPPRCATARARGRCSGRRSSSSSSSEAPRGSSDSRPCRTGSTPTRGTAPRSPSSGCRPRTRRRFSSAAGTTSATSTSRSSRSPCAGSGRIPAAPGSSGR